MRAVRPPMLPSEKSLAGPIRSHSSPRPVCSPISDIGLEHLIDHHHQIGANRELTGASESLVCAQFFRAVDAGFDGTGDAVGEKVLAGDFQQFNQFIFVSFAGKDAELRKSRFAQHAGRLAVFVPVNRAAGGIGGVGGDAGQRQRLAVGDADVNARADQEHGMIGRNRVEIVAGGMALFSKPSLVVAESNDPFARRLAFCVGLDQLHNVGDAVVRGRVEIERRQRPAGQHRVRVRVVQPRRGGAAAEIDDLGGGAGGGAHRGFVIAQSDHPAGADRQRADFGSRGIHCQDRAVVNEKISVHVLFLPNRRLGRLDQCKRAVLREHSKSGREAPSQWQF